MLRGICQLALWFGLAWGSLPLTASAAAQVDALLLHKSDDGVHISGSVSLDVTGPVEEALLKGISVVFLTQVELVRERWYWYDKVISRQDRGLKLSYQPLTRRWRVQQLGSSTSESGFAQTHDSLTSALGSIRRIARMKLADWSDLDTDTKYTVELRFKLDTSQLPRPFQIGAISSPDWNISTSRTIRFVNDGKPDPGK